MNIRTASLLTALLFLATPLAFLPAATAAVAEPYTCPDPAAESDKLFAAACAVASNLPGDWARTNGAINDADNDGRPDARMVSTQGRTVPVPVPVDFFFDDADPATADNPFELGEEQQVFDFALHARPDTRISNVFTHEVAFTDTTRGANTHNAEEPYTIAVYRTGATPLCILCLDVPAQRIVFSSGTAPEGIVDLDADDESIQSRSGVALLHVRLPDPVDGIGQGPAYYDGQRFQLDEAFVHADGTPDLDDDGHTDDEEQVCFSNPTNPLSTCDDVDGDLVGNDDEFDQGRDPFAPDPDSDGDNFIDAIDNCPSKANADQQDTNVPKDGQGDACDDTDGDGRTDATELSTAAGDDYSDWQDADTDNDGLNDGDEVAYAGAGPKPKTNKADTDGDGLSDSQEIAFGSQPGSADGDADGLTDPQEQSLGTKPQDSDTDDDGASDGAEVTATTDPKVADTDADGLNDGREMTLGTNPKSPDTDGDGVRDGDEVTKYGTDPKSANTDNDDLTDKQEIDDNTRTVGPVTREWIIPIQHVPGTPFTPGVSTPFAVYAFLDPTVADTDGDGTDDGPDDLGTVSKSPVQPPGPGGVEPPGGGVNEIVGGLPRPPSPILLVDQYDPHDVDDDGQGNRINEDTNRVDNSDQQANGQVDFVETSIMYYDPDESEHAAGFPFGRFEGETGVTVTMFQNMNGREPTLTVRYGDVTRSETNEILVVENTNLAPFTVCILNVGGAPVAYSMVLDSPAQQDSRFDPMAAEPCGQPSTVGEVNSILEAGACTVSFVPDCIPAVVLEDDTGDGIPERALVTLPDPASCNPDTFECAYGPTQVIDFSDATGTLDGAVATVMGLLGECSPANPPSCLPEDDPVPPLPDDDPAEAVCSVGTMLPPCQAPDGDADGVPDAEDECPAVAGPAPSGCPPPPCTPDPDGDGKCAPADECPEEAANTANGCPATGGAEPDPTACLGYWATEAGSPEESAAAAACDAFVREATGSDDPGCGLLEGSPELCVGGDVDPEILCEQAPEVCAGIPPPGCPTDPMACVPAGPVDPVVLLDEALATLCAQDPVGLPVCGTEAPTPEAIIGAVCAEDPVGLPVCGGEVPGVPCDPMADPTGCAPEGIPDVVEEQCAEDLSDLGLICIEEDPNGGPVLGLIPGQPVKYGVYIDLGLFVLHL